MARDADLLQDQAYYPILYLTLTQPRTLTLGLNWFVWPSCLLLFLLLASSIPFAGSNRLGQMRREVMHVTWFARLRPHFGGYPTGWSSRGQRFGVCFLDQLEASKWHAARIQVLSWSVRNAG